MEYDWNHGGESIWRSERSDRFPVWARRMMTIAVLITTSPAWLSGLELLLRYYNLLPTAPSPFIGSTIHGYTTGEIWLSTLVAELFILVVWRGRQYRQLYQNAGSQLPRPVR